MPTVLATVLLDPPTTLMAGGIMALVSAKLIARRGLPELWRATQYAALWSLLYGLAVGWMFFFRPDWMFVYLLDSARIPLGPVYLLFLFILVGFGVLGVLGVGVLLHLGKRAWAWLVALSAAAAFVGCLMTTTDRYARVGTFQQWASGTAPRLQDDGTMTTAMTVSSLVFGLAAVAIIVMQVRRTVKRSG